jgi:hypothetical protein
MKTDIETLRKANWEQLESDVVDRVRLIRAMAMGIDKNKVTDQIANDLVLPAVRLLAEFCAVVKTDENAPEVFCTWTHVGDGNDYHAGCSRKIAHYMPVDFVCGDWEYCVWCGRKIKFTEVDP